MLNKVLTTIFSKGMCCKMNVQDTHVMSSHDVPHDISILLHTNDAIYRLDYISYYI